MGIWGWNEIEDNQLVAGVVKEVDQTTSGDGDWCLKVAPDDPRYLKNPTSGNVNSNGLIECEIKAQAPSTSFNDPISKFFAPSLGRRVQVLGTWSIDRAHTFDDHAITDLGGDEHRGKTEIHPISGITWIDHEDLTLGRRTFGVFAAVDTSGVTFLNPGDSVPHRGESRYVRFYWDVSDLLPGARWGLTVEHLHDTNRVATYEAIIDSSFAGRPMLRLTIVTGAGNLLGGGFPFYFGTVTVRHASSMEQ